MKKVRFLIISIWWGVTLGFSCQVGAEIVQHLDHDGSRASGGASGDLNFAGVRDGSEVVVEGTAADKNAGKCGWTDKRACVLAVAGYAQAVANLATMLSNFSSRDQLTAEGTDWSRPDFRFPDPGDGDGDGDGTTQSGDGGDDSSTDEDNNRFLKTMEDAIRSGKYEDYKAAKDTLQKEIDKNLDELAGKGYKYDPKKGTISGPFGTKSLSDINSNSSKSAWAKDLKSKALESLRKSSMDNSRSMNKWKRRKPTANKSKRDVSRFLKKLDKGQINSSKMAGMSRNIGNGKMGPSIGNLFKAIQNRYNVLEENKEFK